MSKRKKKVTQRDLRCQYFPPYLRSHCHCLLGHGPCMAIGIANSVQLQWTLNGNGFVWRLGMLLSGRTHA